MRYFPGELWLAVLRGEGEISDRGATKADAIEMLKLITAKDFGDDDLKWEYYLNEVEYKEYWDRVGGYASSCISKENTKRALAYEESLRESGQNGEA